MRRLDWFQLIAVCGALCLAAALVARGYLFDASEDAVSRSMRYDVSWTGANGRMDAAEMEKSVARYAALGLKADADAARLFYQITLSRMDTWGSGWFRKFIESSPKRKADYAILRGRIEGLASDFDQLEHRDAQKRILDRLAEISPIIDRIGAEAHTDSVAEATTIRDDLHHKQRLQWRLITLLLAAGATFLILTLLQNRSLRAANREVARNSEHLAFLARHDFLTKLPNRPAFDVAFRNSALSKRDDEFLAVAAIDLDGFKGINDMLGHAAGDTLLAAVSRRFVEVARQADPRNVVCRAGGDEFLVLMVVQHGVCEAEIIANRIMAASKDPIETAFGTMIVGSSIGVAVKGGDGEKEDAVIFNADLALTEAKNRGKGMVLVFDQSMHDCQQRRLRIEADLRRAIMECEIVPHYQLQFGLASGRPIGMEALARWHHPELGPIAPSEFIPIAESSGCICDIGRLMLRTASRDTALLPHEIGVSVNLSVVQILKDDVVAAVAEALEESGLHPSRLTLEITESVMMSDLQKVLVVLDRLKTLGVSISLDDFGTGYSALSYLTKFKWDELKIDRSFIDAGLADGMNLAIIRSVRLLAHKIGAKVMVEGVETHDQLEILKRIGCDAVQGFALARPMPADGIPAALLRGVARPHHATEFPGSRPLDEGGSSASPALGVARLQF